MNYDFYNPVKLITGKDCVLNNAQALASLGKRCIIVTGKTSAVRSGALADLQQALDTVGIAYLLTDEVEPNPLLETAHRDGERAREFGAEFVVGIGGGSPLDAAKAVAVYATNPMPILDIYKNEWKAPILPIVAIGTTAGTGSEVGPFSVMTMPNGKKQSFGSPLCFPQITFADPKYTYSLPLKFTISTALDALAHILEGYYNNRANDMSDFQALEAMRMLVPALTHLSKMGEDQEVPHDVREKLFYASIVAGYTLARCGTCYCHRLGYLFTEEHDVPHGTACAVFLPQFVRRAAKLMPEKAQAMFIGTNTTLEQLCGLVDELVDFPEITLSQEVIEDLVDRGMGSNNFLNTAPYPQGLTREEALEFVQIVAG